jgi:hypothetical protein
VEHNESLDVTFLQMCAPLFLTIIVVAMDFLGVALFVFLAVLVFEVRVFHLQGRSFTT